MYVLHMCMPQKMKNELIIFIDSSRVIWESLERGNGEKIQLHFNLKNKR